ncbi:hypothetical protein [Pseudoalteromonas sp.]|uniref:hypothetical protein n=1 Tax=Pseudoalteromonas sp. TaxID=53249 RepID=UPI0030032C4B
MLIYVNQFNLIGSNEQDVVFSTLSGWIKQKTQSHFSIDQLKSGETYEMNRVTISTYVSTQFEPELYSVVLRHPDTNVHGRFWMTEITIKVENGKTQVFVLVETSETSTQVKEVPITTRPLFVQFLLQNAKLSNSTIGLEYKTLNNLTDEFKGLSYEIESKNRKHPLVLLSCVKNGKPFVRPEALQQQLVGLAQVIYLDHTINSYDLAHELGDRYSAWDGAINIIYPSKGKGVCYNNLLTRVGIEEIVGRGENIVHEILSYVTHSTNGFNRRGHIGSTDVKAKRQKDQRIALKQKFSKLSHDGEYKDLAEQAFSYLDSQEEVFEQKKCELEGALSHVEEQLDKANQDNIVLQSRISGFINDKKEFGTPLLVYGEERDLYDNEIPNMVIALLNEKSSSVQEYSRVFDVVKDLLHHNQGTDSRRDLKEVFKVTFNNYQKVTPQIRSEWKSNGFVLSEDGQHYNLKYSGEERYKVTFAKTPSDNRAGKNIVSIINKMFF